jgi:protein TonB
MDAVSNSRTSREGGTADLYILVIVKLEAFGENADDPGRSRRLAIGYAAALTIIAGLFVAGAVFGGQIKKQVFEEEVDVKFVKKAEPAKAPPPPPPPPPAIKVASRSPAALGNANAPPKEIPKELPKEGDPNHPKAETPHLDGVGDPNGVLGGTGKGGAGPVHTAPAPPTATAPEPPPPPQETVAEASTPPVALSKPLPAYPEEARKQGIEAIVVVKFFVELDGSVTDVKVVRGHALFDDAVKAMVATWKFTAGTVDGKPMRMSRIVKIPFKLRTQ